MALKLYLVALLSSALIIYSEAQIGAITGPPATEPPTTTTTTTTTAQPQRGQSTIENFWPNKCEKKSKRSAGNKGSHSDSSSSDSHSGGSSKSLEKGSEGKKTICAAWAIWKTTFGGTCKANSVCSLQIQNSYVPGKTFFATRAICQGGCPQGFECKSTDKAAFCAANKGAYVCLKGAFTSKGSLVGLSTCQPIPTQPPTVPTISITFPQ